MMRRKRVALPCVLVLVLLGSLFNWQAFLFRPAPVRAASPNLVCHSPSRGKWTVVFTPLLSSINVLKRVAVVSAADIWAVGYQHDGNSLIDHWDGGSWSYALSPNLPGILFDVTAISANNV